MSRFPLLVVLTLSFLVMTFGQQGGFQDELRAYPLAEKGQVRFVWNPPKQANENEARVELIVGKIIETDGKNIYSLAGKIETVPIKGWGYDRYVVISDSGLIKTLMGVPAGTPKVNKFISMGRTPVFVRYNSKLPVVVYAPEGFIVRFRVWRPDETLIDGQPG